MFIHSNPGVLALVSDLHERLPDGETIRDSRGETIRDSRGEERHVVGEHRPVDDVDQHWTRDGELRLKTNKKILLHSYFFY